MIWENKLVNMHGTEDSNPFQSFWMAGFECADHLNAAGDRVDFMQLTGHLDQLDDDYGLLKKFNILTVREGIRWSEVEVRPYQYDFSLIGKMIYAGRRKHIQQVWDICHFGFPDDLSPLHPHFTARFVSLCKEFVNFCLPRYGNDPLIITPINEVSFLSWLGGEVGATSPYAKGNGWEVKYALMRAYIEGVKAMKEISDRVVILTTEPLINVVPPFFATEEEIQEAAKAHELQFQSIDMLCGKICPELGGHPDLIDVMGFNYYYNNQWLLGFQECLNWKSEIPDPRWKPLSSLLISAHQRYNKPIALTETSHPGEDRGLWISMVADEVLKVVNSGIPFYGVCLYPIIDRPDWDNTDCWHHSGLWDNTILTGRANRVINLEYERELTLAQGLLLQSANQATA